MRIVRWAGEVIATFVIYYALWNILDWMLGIRHVVP